MKKLLFLLLCGSWASDAISQTPQRALEASIKARLRKVDSLLQVQDPMSARHLAESTLTTIQQEKINGGTYRAECQILLGLAHIGLGHSSEALIPLTKAAAELSEESSLKADCYDAMGLAYTDNENKDLATQFHEQALDIRQKIFGFKSIPTANSYNNLGRVYAKDEPLQAIIFFNRAKRIYEKELGPDSKRALRSKLNIAFASTEQKNYEEALTLLYEVKDSYEKTYGAENTNVAFTLSSIGRVQLLQKKYKEALMSQKEALHLYLNMYGSKHPEVANTLYLIGEIFKAQAAFKMALDFYQQSIYANLIGQTYQDVYDLPTLKNYLNADILLTSLQAKATGLEALHYQKSLRPKDLKGAIDTYSLCDALITKIRQNRLNENDKLRLGRIASEVYERGIQLSLNLSEQSFQPKKHMEKAFEFCERSKSSVLLEAITESNAKNFANIPSELISYEDSLKEEISFLEQQLAAQLEEDPKEMEDLLFAYQNSYRDFISKLEAEFPDYYSLKYDNQLASTQDVMDKLAANQAMLSYFIGKEEIYLFIIQKNKLTCERIELPEKFERWVSAFNNTIKYRLKGSFLKMATQLHQSLIPKLSPGIQSLLILPDGKLGSLPFEVLISPKENADDKAEIPFLLKDFSVSYDYSATLYANRKQKVEAEDKSILLVAPIQFKANEIVMNDLPGTAEEIDQIALHFKGVGGRPTLKKGKEASEWLLKNESLATYPFVHLATHGIVDQEKPALSRIFLTPTDGEDGSLYTGELYNLKLKADLVTLSACETGLGKIAQGEGIVGLSRALQYAGANNIMVSLWTVSDQSTAQIMIAFYKYYLSNRQYGYRAALQSAKRSLMASSDYSDPYFWAPFILIGQ